MTSEGAPYISVVVAARNDNHGGNMLGRMQGMLTSWISQAESCNLSSEIVVVEWNPPRESARLKEALSWPVPASQCEVRIVDVPSEVHARFANAATVPLHQMIAKNVGIRRARGKFVLATNLDIIFSAELMQFLAGRRLEEGSMYRIDRHDVESDAPNGPIRELLAFCKSHTRRVFAREGEFALLNDGRRQLDQQDIVSAEAGIHFGRGWSQVECSEGLRYRWIDREAELFLEPSSIPSLVLQTEAGPSAGSAPVSIEILDGGGQTLARATIGGRSTLRLSVPRQHAPGKIVLSIRGADLPVTRHPRIVNLRATGLTRDTDPTETREQWRLDASPTGPACSWGGTFEAPSPFAPEIGNAAFLHTNACGDFTLLSREDWFSLRGYPEFPIWPMHIDAMLCYAAHHAGIREKILREPIRIYHVEHSAGAGWTPEGEKARLARLAAKGVQEMSFATFAKWVDLMRRYDTPVTFTSENWGLGEMIFHEETISAETAA